MIRHRHSRAGHRYWPGTAAAAKSGARGRVIETLVSGDKILIGLKVTGPPGSALAGGETGRWQVFTVRGGPLAGGANLADCRALIGDWLAGWNNQHSFHGPVLIITPAGEPALAGQVGLGDRGDRVAELVYGIAPDRRGRGYATRAARLTAHWLLHEQQASMVELRIDADNTASQRVAAAAGFTPAGTIQSHVPATGETYDDLRFVLRRH